MIRTEIQDAAISAAKAYGHAAVEPRHVLYALARRFREHPELGQAFAAARDALEPRGDAMGAPTLTEEAVALLQTIASQQDAEAALAGAFVARPGAGQRSGGSDTQEQGESAVAARTASATRGAGPAEGVTEVLAELDALVGLGPVKAQVRRLIAVVQANTQRVQAGLTPVNPNLHLVFTGPPGTGKTTVARLMARLYRAAGALPGAGFTESTREDLVAGYVGQTAIKTREVIERTRPGVLFIDEAYALTPRSGVDFGYEAIATLVKAMEDHRDDLAVIVAGYENEMAELIDSNPGLRSRFKTYIAFPDYDAAELTEIFRRFADASGIQLAPGVLDRARQVFAQSLEKKSFGNARFARSLFEQAYARMAARAAEDGVVTVDEVITLLPDDIQLEVDQLLREPRRIGFARAE